MRVSEEEVKGGKTAKSVRSNGHPASGGHTTRAFKPNSSPFSRVNRSRWDMPSTSAGDDMPYQYQEYPKHIYNDPKNPKSYILVHSPEDEQLALGGEEIIDEDVERNRLLTLASVKKVAIDKRWGPGKITKAIEDAGFDPTINPFK